MTKGRLSMIAATATAPLEAAFAEVVNLIHAARGRTWRAVDTELIDLYWRIGEHLHHRIAADGWAQGTVVQLAAYIVQREPGMRGFSAPNLWRMRQFFDAYRDEPGLSTLLRVLPWTHNLIILGQAKRPEEREFCLRQAIQERWSSRELGVGPIPSSSKGLSKGSSRDPIRGLVR